MALTSSFRGQCCALGVFQQVIESALLEVFTTLDKVLQAAREGLEHLVNHATLLEKSSRQRRRNRRSFSSCPTNSRDITLSALDQAWRPVLGP